ncbi:hypothetical protein [Bradyrhizobium sp. SZCCHNPS1003]|uniref:hypothetical protein n=1 Tax=Bradyrhizobium sp. SZCCHNPS1003 TaxID=3057330 RepID=UPI0028E580CB|nr:hypothetical protein [Bradyrhizobium sp. SZCCHNPS1003]
MTNSPLILPDAAEGRWLLVVVGRLDGTSLPPKGLFCEPVRGYIDDIGFCSGLDRALTQRPPRYDIVPYDHMCSDRSFFFRPDESGSSLGSVEVKEALVYDQYMRGDIDFTGFRVTISLREQAYQAYLSHVGLMRQPELRDRESWDGRLLFRIPSRPFAFPMPRGNSDPWTFGKRVVDPLQVIARFAFDEIEIQLLRDDRGRRVTMGEAACDGDPGWQAPLRLRA